VTMRPIPPQDLACAAALRGALQALGEGDRGCRHYPKYPAAATLEGVLDPLTPEERVAASAAAGDAATSGDKIASK
jgi:hypothetical protein